MKRWYVYWLQRDANGSMVMRRMIGRGATLGAACQSVLPRLAKRKGFVRVFGGATV